MTVNQGATVVKDDIEGNEAKHENTPDNIKSNDNTATGSTGQTVGNGQSSSSQGSDPSAVKTRDHEEREPDVGATTGDGTRSASGAPSDTQDISVASQPVNSDTKETGSGGGPSASTLAEASRRIVQNPETWRTSRALVLALVILAMTTLPALYISFTALEYVVAASSFQSPGRLTHFVFAYALIKSDLFNLFTIAALPTLTAYFGSSDSKYREGFFPWLLFTYFVLLFVSTFVPQVVADAAYANHADWSAKVNAIAGTTENIQNYLTNVRNSAIGGIAVLTGIKLAS